MTEINSTGFWQKISTLRYLLYSLFFFFMPFTQALTFNLGFPLKLSELALILLAILYIATGRKVRLPKPILYCISFFFFIISVSVIINLIWPYDYPLKEYPSRFGYNGDSIMRYGYFILSVLAFFVSVDIFLSDRRLFIRIWLYGAIIAALYSWYLTTFSYFKWPVYLLPGMTVPPQTVGDGIIRCGTFLEGNYMGLYLLVSGAMAFYIRKFGIGLFLLVSIFTTFSTLSLLSVFLFLALYLGQFMRKLKYAPFFFLGLIVIIPLGLFFLQTDLYRTFIHEKLFSSSHQANSPAGFSKVDRLVTIKTAVNTWEANPVLGVGLSNFGRHYARYYDRFGMNDQLYTKLRRDGKKVIPNNIYIEILTESGTIALLTFVVFLVLLLRYARADLGKTLFPALLCMILCFNAYPSFIMIYLWSFMALPVANYMKSSQPQRT